MSNRVQTIKTSTSLRPYITQKWNLNHLDQNEPFHNAANANATVIQKPIASIAPDVSNAQVPILPHNVYEKTNPTSNVFSAMATIQQTIKAVLFTKTYKREPSHLFDETKKANFLMPSHTRTSLLPPPTLLLSNLHSLHPWLLTLNPNNKTRIGNSRIHHNPIFKNWKPAERTHGANGHHVISPDNARL